MQDAPQAMTEEQPAEPGRFDRQVQAQMLTDHANQYAQIAKHQAGQAETIGTVNPWIAGRYANAAKANKRLAVALAEHAKKLAA